MSCTTAKGTGGPRVTVTLTCTSTTGGGTATAFRGAWRRCRCCRRRAWHRGACGCRTHGRTAPAGNLNASVSFRHALESGIAANRARTHQLQDDWSFWNNGEGGVRGEGTVPGISTNRLQYVAPSSFQLPTQWGTMQVFCECVHTCTNQVRYRPTAQSRRMARPLRSGHCRS